MACLYLLFLARLPRRLAISQKTAREFHVGGQETKKPLYVIASALCEAIPFLPCRLMQPVEMRGAENGDWLFPARHCERILRSNLAVAVSASDDEVAATQNPARELHVRGEEGNIEKSPSPQSSPAGGEERKALDEGENGAGKW